MITLWKQVPNDILDIILSYDGTIKCRNGIYMNQILKTDNRYVLLTNIPKMQIDFRSYYTCKKIEFSNIKYKLKIKSLAYLHDSCENGTIKTHDLLPEYSYGTEYWQITKDGSRYEFTKSPLSFSMYLWNLFSNLHRNR
jgi:hypothetical protein